jgi:glycopeptide antibiotics resistance protein
MTTTPGSARATATVPRRLVVGFLVVYLALVARITLWPQPAPSDVFDVVREATQWLGAHHVPISYDVVEASSNVVMFVPFGVLVGLLLARRWLVVALGCALSVAIETSQALFLPTRVADPRDVVMNTLGAALGVLLVSWWRRR